VKDEWDGKSDEKKNSETYRQATEEYKELVETVATKNRILKDIIDHMRRIIWEINTMLMMRRSWIEIYRNLVYLQNQIQH